MSLFKYITVIASLLLLVPTVLAKETLSSSTFSVLIVSLWITILTVLILLVGTDRLGKHKKLVFTFIAVPVIMVTLYLAISTVHENIISVTKGPVHWHADYEVLYCGERLNLIDPKFPSNKVGNPVIHEHDDDRMHVEGTVPSWDKVTLGYYFSVLGGALEEGHLQYQTTTELVDVYDGYQCPDGRPGTLQVFVNGKRIRNYGEYVPYPHVYVPPGDCIIFSFAPDEQETTSIVCESWQAYDWTYETYSRPSITIGDRTWQ